jgi:hypothetical protein
VIQLRIRSEDQYSFIENYLSTYQMGQKVLKREMKINHKEAEEEIQLMPN